MNYKRRVEAIFRKYKLVGFALISAFGLLSAFAVNLAGFLLPLPKPLWGLVDASFVSSYFLRFSTVVALAFLASRYSVYLVSSILSAVLGVFSVLWLVATPKGHRFINIRGRVLVNKVVESLLTRQIIEEKYRKTPRNFRPLAKMVMKYHFFRVTYTVSYVFGARGGAISFHVERYGYFVATLTAVLVVSVFLATISGGILLVVGTAIFFAFLPPSLWQLAFSNDRLRSGVSLPMMVRLRPWSIVSIQKVTAIVLTMSFALGFLHHQRLVSDDMALLFSGASVEVGSLVIASNSGFIIFNVESGYRFLPLDGTRIFTQSEPESIRLADNQAGD